MDAGPRVSRSSCVSPLWRAAAIGAFAVIAIITLAAPPPAWAGFDAAAVFNLQCAGCHSVGKGEVVGFVNRYRHADGTYRKLEWRARRSGSGLAARAVPVAMRALFVASWGERHGGAEVMLESAIGALDRRRVVPTVVFLSDGELAETADAVA